MNNHTKEPCVSGSEFNHMTGGFVSLLINGKKYDARRIAACVHVCDGIETDHLEKNGLPDFAGKISALVEQRVELLNALKDCVESLKVHNPYWSTDRENIVGFAEKIIAEVEGKNDLS